MESISSINNNVTKRYVAFFDLDGTIISANSGKTFVKYSFKKGLMTSKDFIKGIYLSLLFRLGLRRPERIIETMIGWLQGVPVNKLEELSYDLFNNHLKETIHCEAKNEIIFHKNRGARVVILSSAILPVCKDVAGYLDIDDIICSNLEVVNGIFTGNSSGPPCFGVEKVNRLRDYCNKNNVELANSWYYGDSVSDIPALNIVGNPVCISPDRKLKKIALEKGWSIKFWQ